MQNDKAEMDKLIKKFSMQPHPEGGYYVETFRSRLKLRVPQEIYQATERSASTLIYYLLAGDTFSAWHKVKSDETWYFHLGSTLTIPTIDEKGILNKYILGNPLLEEKSVLQITIPGGVWFCAHTNDPESYSLSGCMVAPGFEFADFELGNRQKLIATYPQHEEIIRAFTRLKTESYENSFHI